jgi:hypothetical protein
MEQFPKRCGNLHFDESIIPRNCYESDGVCTMQCAPGYHPVEGSFELTCLPEGEWSGQPLGNKTITYLGERMLYVNMPILVYFFQSARRQQLLRKPRNIR